MLAGHLGAALAVGRIERRINLGVFVWGALLLDVLLWVFVLLGWERVAIPADFARTHQAAFDFPVSHGLPAALGWSVLFGAFAAWVGRVPGERRVRAAVLLGAAVFSHWLLDAAVHVPELPLGGPGSVKVGLALATPAALALEAAVVVLGLWLFLQGSRLSRARRVAVAALTMLLLGFTGVGMTVAPAPPSAAAMAASSLVTVLVVCALFGWIGMAAPQDRALPPDGGRQAARS